MFGSVDLGGYDTDKPQHYLDTYAAEFGHLAEEPIALLELGVQRGGSILLWQDVLPKAQIAGLDLNPIPVEVDESRTRIFQGFQQDAQLLGQVASQIAPDGFDVVIDDASHMGRYTAESFWAIFPSLLRPGGVYIIDDWDCAYRDDWSDGHKFTGSRGSIEPARQVATAAGAAERARRRVRSAARPIASRLANRPELRQRLERVYMRAEGASMKTRMPSHDYGMAGFGKQLVDACTIDHILGPGHRIIELVKFLPNQIVVRKLA